MSADKGVVEAGEMEQPLQAARFASRDDQAGQAGNITGLFHAPARNPDALQVVEVFLHAPLQVEHADQQG